MYFHCVLGLRGTEKQLCKHYLSLSFPCEILKCVTYFTFIFCSFSYIFFSVWPRWDLNIKSTNICFLLKKICHPLFQILWIRTYLQSFPISLLHLKLKNQKNIFLKHSLFLSLIDICFVWFFETADKILKNVSWCRTCLALARASK